MGEKTDLREPLLRVIGYCLDEEPIAGMTYSETKAYVHSTYQKVSTFFKEKFQDFEENHPNWKEEVKEGSKGIVDATVQTLKEEQEHLKGKIASYYYENRTQKKEESSS